MEDNVPQEQPSSLLPFLPHLADIISNDGDVDKASDDFLHNANLSKDESAIRQLSNLIKVLQDYNVNYDANQKEYVARLIKLGIPIASAELTLDRIHSASAELTLDRIREEEPSEIEFELRRHNYVRAVILAQQNQYHQEKIHCFQELALRQYAADYRNLPGFRVLVKEWEIPQNRVKKILKQLLEETRTYAVSEDSLQYDGHTMQNLTLSQWIQNTLESSSKW